MSAIEVPQANKAEQHVIGTMLYWPESWDRALEILTPTDFYQASTRAAFAGLVALDERGEATGGGCETLALEIERQGNGRVCTADKLAEWLAAAPSASVMDRMAKEVKEASVKRELQRAAATITKLALDGQVSAQEATERADAALFDIRADTPSQAVPLGGGWDEWREAAEKRGDNPDCPTGWIDLDDKIGGLVPGRSVVIAARPGIGKTSCAVHLTRHLARRGLPVLFVSLEMSHQELLGRFLSLESGIPAKTLTGRRLGETHKAIIDKQRTKIEDWPIEVVANGVATVGSIRAAARRMKRRYGQLSAVVVDYLQLMHSTSTRRSDNRQVEVGELSRGMKLLAQELKVPVVVLSQLNRGVEARQDRRPSLSDLRESGAIENDADQVLMLYRDDYYQEFSAEPGVAEVIISKNRHGETGTVKLKVDMALGTWENLSRSPGRTF